MEAVTEMKPVPVTVRVRSGEEAWTTSVTVGVLKVGSAFWESHSRRVAVGGGNPNVTAGSVVTSCPAAPMVTLMSRVPTPLGAVHSIATEERIEADEQATVLPWASLSSTATGSETVPRSAPVKVTTPPALGAQQKGEREGVGNATGIGGEAAATKDRHATRSSRSPSAGSAKAIMSGYRSTPVGHWTVAGALPGPVVMRVLTGRGAITDPSRVATSVLHWNVRSERDVDAAVDTAVTNLLSGQSRETGVSPCPESNTVAKAEAPRRFSSL